MGHLHVENWFSAMSPMERRAFSRGSIFLEPADHPRLPFSNQQPLNDPGTHPVDGRSFAFKDLIIQQAWQYKHVVFEEQKEYSPVVIK
jgi:hypothetical protein